MSDLEKILLAQTSYYRVVRDENGTPIDLIPIPEERVTPIPHPAMSAVRRNLLLFAAVFVVAGLLTYVLIVTTGYGQ